MTDTTEQVRAYLTARAALRAHGADLGDQIAKAKNADSPWAPLTETALRALLAENEQLRQQSGARLQPYPLPASLTVKRLLRELDKVRSEYDQLRGGPRCGETDPGLIVDLPGLPGLGPCLFDAGHAGMHEDALRQRWGPMSVTPDLEELRAELGQAQYDVQNLTAERDALRAALQRIDTIAWEPSVHQPLTKLREALATIGDCHLKPLTEPREPCLRIHGHVGYHRNASGVVWARATEQPPGDAHSATQPTQAPPAAHESHSSASSPQRPAPGATP
jgi:DNA repair exonuclease SbcCD ATPase subunit